MFTYSIWLSLTLPERQEVARKLGIAKTGSTHVVNDRVESDGYALQAVEAALESFARENSINDPETLKNSFKKLLAPETSEVVEEVPNEVPEVKEEVKPAEVEKPKRGRKPKTV